uniref:Uncharacterized protein n=1 Tax=Anopheles braziliensis TaxID=58242 RepID=A0A2M3ZLA8_9DIPT
MCILSCLCLAFLYALCYSLLKHTLAIVCFVVVRFSPLPSFCDRTLLLLLGFVFFCLFNLCSDRVFTLLTLFCFSLRN